MTISARSFAALAALAFGLSISVAQTPDPPSRAWHAEWVTHPTAPLREPLVLHFRRAVKLDAVLASYIVRVSADNRFILYVNGKRVGDGPARGDLTHWRYQRYDLAPYLKTGDNLITATVWNFGVYAPVAQMSDRTAFLLESEAKDASAISTPKGWQVEIEPGQVPIPRVADGSWEYMAAGTGEELDAAFKEILRMYAPAGTLFRQAIADTEIDGHFVPRKSQIAINVYASMRLADWWPEPDRFNPRRFLDGADARPIHRYAFAPFGGGVHKCLGQQFADMNVKAIMHQLLLRNSLHVAPGYEPPIDYGTGPFPADGLPIELRPLR